MQFWLDIVRVFEVVVLKQEVGIVLKSFFPYKSKISVLSRNAGKLSLGVRSAIIPKMPLSESQMTRTRMPISFSPGTIIRFSFDIEQKFPRASRLEVLLVPVDSMRHNLLWLHHLLEICYYFVPLHAASAELFQLVRRALEWGTRVHLFGERCAVIKKIFLLRALVLIGFYPPNDLIFLIDFFDDIVSPLDSSKAQKVRSIGALLEDIDESIVKKIDVWVMRCLQDHPNIGQFRTLSFLNKE